MWRLIYSDKKIYDLFETSGRTYARESILNTSHIEQCFEKIDELGVTYMYPTGTTQIIIFSGGSRSIIENPDI
jgi:hypothetical protein